MSLNACRNLRFLLFNYRYTIQSLLSIKINKKITIQEKYILSQSFIQSASENHQRSELYKAQSISLSKTHPLSVSSRKVAYTNTTARAESGQGPADAQMSAKGESETRRFRKRNPVYLGWPKIEHPIFLLNPINVEKLAKNHHQQITISYA